MIGSFLSRGLAMVFGYAYPAYECFKTVEKNKPDIEDLRFWCQYWILVAVLTVFERVGDTFISWVPMYSEAKLAFFIYLWFPKTKGTTYVYDSFFRPYLAKHETEIDRNLLELRSRAGDYAILYWQRAASYGQTRVFDILQYISAQSTPRPRPTQETVQGNRQAPPISSNPLSSNNPSPSHNEEEDDDDEDDDDEEWVPLPSASTKAPLASIIAQKTVVAKPSVGTTSNPKVGTTSNPTTKSNPKVGTTSILATKTDESEEMETDQGSSSANDESIDKPSSSSVKETVMEDNTLRVTRAMLRKTRGAGASG
ncbi:putative HVA22-like protein g [Impatiens glandulifera]|uniref:putative HVA22-like protein g n=1 Tax=Impatiens glandulifera TaxID=253017 RepID=UPI001FB0815C|nr:putative HVA22-like protein g [Impatiens glandulifera]